MKKLTLAAAAMALLFCFASCSEKEGVYNPKQKIEKISESATNTTEYYDSDSHSWGNSYTETTSKHLAQRWTWDDNTVTMIEYLNLDGTVYSTSTFKYDDDRLVRIENGNEYAVITYNGKKLNTVEMHSPADYDEKSVEEDITVYTMYYDDDKITKINVTGPSDMMFKKSQLKSTLYSTLLPKQMDDIFAKACSIIDKKAGKGAKGESQMSADINLVWTGDNVTKMSTNVDMGFLKMDVTETYTFDKKNNPFKHFVNTFTDGMIFMNENNVLTTTTVSNYAYSFMGESDEETETNNYTYTYEYDGKWPTSVTCQYEYIYFEEDDYGNQTPEYRVNNISTTYYEYK